MRQRKDIGRAFGQVLKELRLEAGLTQEELGFEAGVDRVYVSLLERGQRSPSLAVTFDLAKALGTTATDLVFQSEQRIASKKR
jgi:transcriptional regulator with XRE-family HTH domain